MASTSISEKTAKRLFAVSSNRCAFPDCTQMLIDEKTETIIGEMCHIKGRQAGAARYDNTQSDPERNGFGNLIVMCPSHHKIIDEHPEIYPVDWLLDLKKKHESHYLDEADVELIRFYRVCLDRPAFQDEIKFGRDLRTFDEAVADTITALNTGVLLKRGTPIVLAKAKGKSYLKNPDWRQRMDGIVDQLRSMRMVFKLLEPEIDDYEQYPELYAQIEASRKLIGTMIVDLCEVAGM